MPLNKYLPTLKLAGSYELHLRARPNQPARTAELEIRFGLLSLPVPKQQSPYVKALRTEPIPMTVILVQEVNVPRGTKPITWTLYTSLPISTFDDAWQIVEYYECRWLIEVYQPECTPSALLYQCVA